MILLQSLIILGAMATVIGGIVQMIDPDFPGETQNKTMMALDANGNYNPWVQPEYGFDAQGKPVVPPKGYELVPFNSVILKGFIPFDVYAGWIEGDEWHARNQCHANSSSRWTAWARPINQKSK